MGSKSDGAPVLASEQRPLQWTPFPYSLCWAFSPQEFLLIYSEMFVCLYVIKFLILFSFCFGLLSVLSSHLHAHIQLSERRVPWRCPHVLLTIPLLPLLLHLTGYHPSCVPAATPAANGFWGFWSYSTSSSLFVHMLCFFPWILRQSPRKFHIHRIICMNLSPSCSLLPLFCVSWEMDNSLASPYPTSSYNGIGNPWLGSHLKCTWSMISLPSPSCWSPKCFLKCCPGGWAAGGWGR